MSGYQFLIPQITLFCGVLILGALEIFNKERQTGMAWVVHVFVLALAFLQQLLLYRLPASLYMRGGLVLDGLTQCFSLSILVLALMIQIARRNQRGALLMQTNILNLGLTFSVLFAIQSNRLLFGILAVVAMVWIAQAMLAAESDQRRQSALVHSGMIRGFLFLILCAFLCLLCFALFGETQIDEMQRFVVRGHLKEYGLFAIGILIVFIGALVSGLPPFDGIFGKSRRQASWSLSLGCTGMFAIVGINIFVRWAVFIFTQPAVGAIDLDPSTSWNVLFVLRGIAVVALVLVPLFAIMNSNLRGSIQIFILNPFAQGLFALSFGQRELLGLAIAQVFVSVVTIGLLIASLESISFSPEATLQDWISLGRRDLTGCFSIILSLASLSGLAPFYGSLLLQKTLSINSIFGLFLLLNVVLGGFYVGRLMTLAFHRGTKQETQRLPSQWQRFWFVTQFILLIFMGIFWQPLYKYGAYSIRSFFGEI